jgi:tungstate transport system substrate-binding protein
MRLRNWGRLIRTRDTAAGDWASVRLAECRDGSVAAHGWCAWRGSAGDAAPLFEGVSGQCNRAVTTGYQGSMQRTDDFFHGQGGGSPAPERRRLLGLIGALAVTASSSAGATRVRSMDDPLLVGVDRDLERSGLARALQRAFARDVGVALRLEAAPAAVVLGRLEAGELDAGLTNAATAEQRLADQGLVHDRIRVATGRFVLVGPAPASGRAPAADTDALALLQRIARDAATPDGLRFVSPQDGSGAHLAEQGLWRAAGVAPQPPWYLRADPQAPLLPQAREATAVALIDAALFAGPTAAGMTALVEHDPRLRFDVHLMRSFRVHHPAGQLFTRWVAGARGRRVVASVRGYAAVSA